MKRERIAAVVVVLALAVGACGTGDEPATTTAVQPTPVRTVLVCIMQMSTRQVRRTIPGGVRQLTKLLFRSLQGLSQTGSGSSWSHKWSGPSLSPNVPMEKRYF